jgi:hypothetical protein
MNRDSSTQAVHVQLAGNLGVLEVELSADTGSREIDLCELSFIHDQIFAGPKSTHAELVGYF